MRIRRLLFILLFITTTFGLYRYWNVITAYAQSISVTPTVETDSFSGSGDIADDSAIWLNPANPAQSVVIGDNKDDPGGGLGIFGLDGKLIHFRPDGKIGNVDLRNNFSFGGQPITLVGANHRGNNSIVLYKLNHSTRQLEPIPGTRSTSTANYGFCFYKSKQSGKTYAFVPHESGLLEQHELVVSGSSINTTKVRSVSIGSQSEGCVGDDELGHLYVGQESTALWKYNAEPSGGSTRTAVDTVSGGKLVADVEGVTIAYGANGTGYLFVSNQDAATFNVYRREGNNAYVKTFSIGANGTIDAVSSTDGIDVMNGNFGSAFPKGLFVAHDASNSNGNTSNLKFVPLDRIVDMGGTGPTSPPVTGGVTQPVPTNTPGGTKFALTVLLHGIGKGGDNSNPTGTGTLSPLTTQRTVTLEVLNASNTVVKSTTGVIVYSTANGNFTGTIDAGTLATGVYTIRVKTDKYLRRQVPGIINATAGQTTTIPTFSMIVGDIINDNKLDISDYNVLLDCFSDLSPPKNCAAQTKKFSSDISDDGNVNQFDYNLFLRELSVQGGGTDPTPSGTGPTNTPVTPEPGASSGIWISKEEIMRLPMSGAAWDRTNSAANSNWGSACLHDNNCMHDVNTLAGALVAVRKNDSAMRSKVITGLQSAMGSSLNRALELSRGFQTYIIAADIIGYHDAAFESWVRKTVTANVQGHSGGVGVLGTATNSSNNWGGHARASLAAAAIYLNDSNYKQIVVTAHKAFIGIGTSSLMVYSDTTWHATSNKAGENRKGAVVQGKNISGVLTEDWRRADTNFNWPPTVTGYMWEGMQGYVVAAVILHRAGLVPFNSGDNAVVRAMDILYGTGEAANNSPLFKNPPAGDDTWIPWVVNYYAGTSYPAPATSPGKNMGWTDWTHAK